MAQGKLKWFNGTKGYGFIQPEGGGPDIFVHISAVEKAGLASEDMKEGGTISYDLQDHKGRTSAINLRV